MVNVVNWLAAPVIAMTSVLVRLFGILGGWITSYYAWLGTWLVWAWETTFWMGRQWKVALAPLIAGLTVGLSFFFTSVTDFHSMLAVEMATQEGIDGVRLADGTIVNPFIVESILFLNLFLPLEQMFGSLNALLALGMIAVGIRIAKSFIPTISG